MVNAMDRNADVDSLISIIRTLRANYRVSNTKFGKAIDALLDDYARSRCETPSDRMRSRGEDEDPLRDAETIAELTAAWAFAEGARWVLSLTARRTGLASVDMLPDLPEQIEAGLAEKFPDLHGRGSSVRQCSAQELPTLASDRSTSPAAACQAEDPRSLSLPLTIWIVCGGRCAFDPISAHLSEPQAAVAAFAQLRSLRFHGLCDPVEDEPYVGLVRMWRDKEAGNVVGIAKLTIGKEEG